jgi:pimeloyl-ACP methyl ester carboxylesterase
MSTHIIYVPGLGDANDRLRAAALSVWWLWGTPATLIPITWDDGQDMDQKMALIQRAIDKIPKGKRIVLIGESAGATLALHTAAIDQRVAKVITLCGVARPDTPVSARLRQKAPALDQAVNTLPEHFDVEVQSVRAAIDNVIGSKYSSVAGSKRHVIWSIGHLFTITLCLTLLAPYMAHIAKRQEK